MPVIGLAQSGVFCQYLKRLQATANEPTANELPVDAR